MSFTAEEKSLVSAVTGFGAVAIANAELCNTAQPRPVSFTSCLISPRSSALLASWMDSCNALPCAPRISWVSGEASSDYSKTVPSTCDGRRKIAGRSRWISYYRTVPPAAPYSPRRSFWSDDPSQVPGINLEILTKFEVRQLLTIPLLDTSGEVLGMLGVLDRQNSARISPEDIRRARALAAQVAVALEVTRNLYRSEQHRKRAESLTRLALELKSHLRLPEFVRSFAGRAADILGARRAALSVHQETGLETLLLHDTEGGEIQDPLVLRRFSRALEDALAQREGATVSAPAAELLGPALASELGGTDLTLVRLVGVSGELVGVLCLEGRVQPLPEGDEQVLQAIAGHAAVALENARLFTRMDQANRHWIEIFDAISDFIVAHDEAGNVLRVNRSLADFIGVTPQELIGVNMSALLAMGDAPPMRSCPFCRTGEGDDEYVHPVLERTYLVSTSRVHGASSEGMQTVHVLKDITDRREAEQRYRELFDNIQEGLFFSTPGRAFHRGQ